MRPALSHFASAGGNSGNFDRLKRNRLHTGGFFGGAPEPLRLSIPRAMRFRRLYIASAFVGRPEGLAYLLNVEWVTEGKVIRTDRYGSSPGSATVLPDANYLPLPPCSVQETAGLSLPAHPTLMSSGDVRGSLYFGTYRTDDDLSYLVRCTPQETVEAAEEIRLSGWMYFTSGNASLGDLGVGAYLWLACHSSTVAP
jgi:hypothetical protein